MKRTLELDQNAVIGNKEYIEYYFKKVVNKDGLFKCRCGKERKQAPKTGFSNLLNHIKCEHKDYDSVVQSELKKGHLLDKYFYPSEKATQIYGWLDWIISEGYGLFLSGY
jgi:hypothetical protein